VQLLWTTRPPTPPDFSPRALALLNYRPASAWEDILGEIVDPFDFVKIRIQDFPQLHQKY
jgi:hypothetical protein